MHIISPVLSKETKAQRLNNLPKVTYLIIARASILKYNRVVSESRYFMLINRPLKCVFSNCERTKTNNKEL